MANVKVSDVSMRKTSQGAWECSALVDEYGRWGGYYETLQFFGYSKRDANQLFRDHVNGGK